MKNQLSEKSTLNFEKVMISKLKQKAITGGVLVSPRHPNEEHSCSCTCIY